MLILEGKCLYWRTKPAHLAGHLPLEVHVFYQDHFLCHALCAELSDRKVTLKEIEKARTERRKQVRAELKTREALTLR